MSFSEQHRQQLLKLARDSIVWGLDHARPLQVSVDDFDDQLQQKAACFVTLHKNGELRGCIGSLEAQRPLVEDVSENAFSAAFRDPRFFALQNDELEQLSLSISVLTPAQPLQFSSEQNLIDQLRPGVDGLILQEGYHRGTFLPSVWEQLPDPKQFLQHLKMKAGLSPDHWSDQIKVSRYQTESFE